MTAPPGTQPTQHLGVGVSSLTAAQADVSRMAGYGTWHTAAKVWTRALVNEVNDASIDWGRALVRDFDGTRQGTPLTRRMFAARNAVCDWTTKVAELGAAGAVRDLLDAFEDAADETAVAS